MTAQILFVDVGRDTPLAAARLPTVPFMLRVETDETAQIDLGMTALYRSDPPGRTRDPYATPRWECGIESRDGRIHGVRFRPDRPDPKTPYDELLDFFVTVSVFGENLEEEDRRRSGLLICAKTLLRFWRDAGPRLRAGLTPPFPLTLI